ncbi:NAD-dependent epimerase/dehydratase family protein [Microbacterium sp. SMR1]|uniref:NAD-dependent epimerase/dehydratase family protein n=1 Tax=Microbacterium sp. SMR1 TaxID=1497340 RepID=UPI000DCC830C|nr:NAD-dependent epimerase/dehydratase family protein [Microbacterium sp. SMR1]RAZ30723.1 UDP-glucuronate 5-epimerase [Microbacterium sp. SMR1]
MSRIFITGDAGFIGFHLAKQLLALGHTVAGYDAISAYYSPRLKQSRLDLLCQSSEFSHTTGRLEDARELAGAMRTFQPDIVVHLAAQAGVRYSITNPEEYISSNIVGSATLLDVLREVPPAHLMLASTSSVYGGNVRAPFSELDTTDAPLSLYAATKRSMESLAHSFSHLHQVPTTVFRFFTVYGPWGRPDMALFKFVRAILNDEPIDIYGFGKMRRDFTYVDDLVRAILKLSQAVPAVAAPIGERDSLSKVAPFRIVNIAGGSPTELMTFVSAIEHSLGRIARKNLMPMQPGDVVSTFADTRLLHDLIGELPSTPVPEGVARFVDWYMADGVSTLDVSGVTQGRTH